MGTLRTGISLRTNPKTGDQKLYASILSYGNIGNTELVNSMVNNSGISRATALASVYALTSTIKNFLHNGHTVNIPQLGKFSISLRTKGQETADEVTANCIEGVHVRFSPIAEVKNACKSVKFSGILVDDTNAMAATLKTGQEAVKTKTAAKFD